MTYIDGPAGARPAVEVDAFIGRTGECAAVVGLLAASRIVTLTGVGGTGKTRLARKVAASVAGESGSPWVFVDLSGVFVDQAVVPTIARAAGVPAASLDGLTNAVRDANLLLVIDNCEQVLAAAAAVCARINDTAPHVRVLATSREPLGLRGEALFVVPPLPTPPIDVSGTSVAGYDAVALFVDRARRMRHDFELDGGSAPAVAEICRQLDGLPLGIELAAQLVRAMSPARIAAGLTERFRLLSRSPRGVPARHTSLRACLEWSYELLSEQERSAFRRLAVFVDPFALPAAEAVLPDDQLATDDVAELVLALVDKSLVVAEPDVDRFRLLKTVREYAADQLAAAGEMETLSRRHRDAFAAIAEGLASLPWPERRSSGGSVAPIMDDLLKAFVFSEQQGAADDVCRLADAVLLALRQNDLGLLNEFHERVAAMLVHASPARRAQVIASSAPWGVGSRPRVSAALALEAAAFLRHAGRRAESALALAVAVEECRDGGAEDMAEVATIATEACSLADAADDVVARAVSRWTVAAVEEAGDVERAADRLAEAMTIADATDHYVAGSAAWRLVQLYGRQGRHREALALVADLMARGDRGGSHRWRADAHRLLTLAHVEGREGAMRAASLGRQTIAGRRPRQTLDILDALMTVVDGIEQHVLGELGAAQAHYRHAESLIVDGVPAGAWMAGEAAYGYWQAMWWQLWCSLGLGEHARARAVASALTRSAYGGPIEIDYTPLVEAVAAREAGDHAAVAVHVHELLPVAAQARREGALAVLMELLAGALSARGANEEAGRVFGAADAVRQRNGGLLRLPPFEGWYLHDVGRLRAAMGSDALAAAWAEGTLMAQSVGAAVAYLRRGRGARGRPTFGWAALTPAERSVVELVTTGLSNQAVADSLHVSTRTVASHLRRIFVKLEVTSRTELARLALTEQVRN